MIEPEELEGLLAERPFRPFALRSADGHDYLVNHPRAVSWAQESPMLVTINLKKGMRVYVDLTLATAIKELDAPPLELVPNR